MSYLICQDCGKKIHLFGESKIESVANSFGISVIDKMPIDSSVAEKVDAGEIEEVNVSYIENTLNAIK